MAVLSPNGRSSDAIEKYYPRPYTWPSSHIYQLRINQQYRQGALQRISGVETYIKIFLNAHLTTFRFHAEDLRGHSNISAYISSLGSVSLREQVG